MTKTEPVENELADIKTVELARAQVIRACSSVHLSVSGVARFSVDGETI